MNIYNKSTIVSFYTSHPNCKKALENWYHDVLTKEWKKPNDIIIPIVIN